MQINLALWLFIIDMLHDDMCFTSSENPFTVTVQGSQCSRTGGPSAV